MTPEERREILEMLASGKISADEASTMLQSDEPANSMESPPADQAIPVEEESVDPIKGVVPSPRGEGAAPSSRTRTLHIHISDLKSGDRRVSVNVPLGFLRKGLALGHSLAPEMRRFTWDDLANALVDEQDGTLVEVKDERDGEHVRILID